MNILSLDTSTNTLRTGLKTDEGWYENLRSTGLKHGEKLVPSIQHILDEAQLQPRELDLIVCTQGPGSFTGLRIGLSTAKGLSEGSGVPLVTISSLEVYGKLYSFFPGTVVPLIDAKKNRFYTCFYENGNPIEKEMDISAASVLELSDQKDRVLFTGPGLDIFMERSSEIVNNMKYSFDIYTKNSFCNILSEMGRKKYETEGAVPPEAGPTYLRASDAEQGK